MGCRDGGGDEVPTGDIAGFDIVGGSGEACGDRGYERGRQGGVDERFDEVFHGCFFVGGKAVSSVLRDMDTLIRACPQHQ